MKRFPPQEDAPAESDAVDSESKSDCESPSDAVLIGVLRDQLQSKESQIQTLETQLDRKDEQILNLNERMREGNILMRELQDRLAIAAPVTPTKPADMVIDSHSQEGSETHNSSDNSDQKPSSIWHRKLNLFRRKRS